VPVLVDPSLEIKGFQRPHMRMLCGSEIDLTFVERACRGVASGVAVNAGSA
jgi:hypothetical protein